MKETYFFEIPIYRCSFNEHSIEMKTKEPEYRLEEFKDTCPESYNNRINYFFNDVWYCWRFNEIVGWIRLYVIGNQIRGEYYWLKSKRITKNLKNKKFREVGKLFELNINREFSSEEIFKTLIMKIENLSKEKSFLKNRYIDLNLLKTFGEYFNWKSFMKKGK